MQIIIIIIIIITIIIIIVVVALQPNAGHGLLIHEVSRSHTTTHHSR
jgi:preprotein translocase subunit SecG